MAPKQEGPYGPKRDRSKGLMDSFRCESALGLWVGTNGRGLGAEEVLEGKDGWRGEERKERANDWRGAFGEKEVDIG